MSIIGEAATAKVNIPEPSGSYIKFTTDSDGEIIGVKFNLGDAVVLPQYMFAKRAKLSSINWPSTITTIGNYAFQDCKGLTIVDIPSNITALGTYSFTGCSNLKTIILRSLTLITWKTNCFPAASSVNNIYVPSSLVESYKAATGWKSYVDKISSIEGAGL